MKILSGQVYDYVCIELPKMDGYKHVLKDFDIAVQLLKQGGHIVVDDTNIAGVSQAFNEFKEKFSSRISKEINAGGPTQVLLFKGTQ